MDVKEQLQKVIHLKGLAIYINADNQLTMAISIHFAKSFFDHDSWKRFLSFLTDDNTSSLFTNPLPLLSGFNTVVFNEAGQLLYFGTDRYQAALAMTDGEHYLERSKFSDSLSSGSQGQSMISKLISEILPSSLFGIGFTFGDFLSKMDEDEDHTEEEPNSETEYFGLDTDET